MGGFIIVVVEHPPKLMKMGMWSELRVVWGDQSKTRIIWGVEMEGSEGLGKGV